MKRWIYTAVLAGVLAMSSGQANAAEFVLGDHPDGNRIADGAYGVRLDGVWSSLFSVGVNIDPAGGGPVTLTFDPGNMAGGASITGIIRLTASTNGGAPLYDEWSLSYSLTGLSEYQGGFKATGGSGSITDLTPGDSDAGFDSITLAGKQDGSGIAFYFAPNGFRLGGHAGYTDDDWVGNGWVQGTYTKYKYGQWYTKEFGSTGSNDFLVTARPEGDLTDVPEPSTMLLTMGGVALLWFRKRRS
ncbi:MAG: PEP-CTERM sorting domain-containing protein [Acidobacteria bacterium]|nr:PEP-CTERM sorting domain-containing protein [Acidobacteriota bacterium]MDA1237220.1 PEP-CTERM sorting domain-containing protein [Acidobacteriota bacterium]